MGASAMPVKTLLVSGDPSSEAMDPQPCTPLCLPQWSTCCVPVQTLQGKALPSVIFEWD
jgi:hypothetical protein